MERPYWVVVAVAACGSRHTAPPATSAQDFGPEVDAGCLAHARAGDLVDTMPATVEGFTVAKAGAGAIHLHRDGRKLADADGAALWRALTDHDTRGPGLVAGSSAMYSVHKCADVGDASCLALTIAICQTDLATVARWVVKAASDAGAADGELGVDLVLAENGGPSCKQGAACVPATHYSRKETYDPTRGRHRAAIGGRGRCVDDGDCEGAGRQHCVAWYLASGGETDIYLKLGEPTFCGCVDHGCTWFTQ